MYNLHVIKCPITPLDSLFRLFKMWLFSPYFFTNFLQIFYTKNLNILYLSTNVRRPHVCVSLGSFILLDDNSKDQLIIYIQPY